MCIKRGLASNYNNIGLIYFNLKDYEKALDYYLQSLALKKDLGNKRGLAYTHHNIGQAYLRMEDFVKALDHFFSALNRFQALGIKADQACPMISIGETYRKQNQLIKAQKYLQKGLDIAHQTGLLNTVRDGAEQLAIVEKALGNYQKAYHAQVLFKQMADSLNNEEMVKKITRLEAEHEFRKEKDSLQIVKQQEGLLLKEKSKRRESRQLAIFIIICSILITAGSYFFFWNKIEQGKQFESLRNRISRDLHDEIGSTLSSIALYGTVASAAIKQDPIKTSELLELINSNASKTIESMNDIVWAINSDQDSVLHLVNRMRSYASEIEDTGEWDIHIRYDPEIIEKELDMIHRRNLYLVYKEAVNNALKYSGGDSIYLEVKATNNRIRMEIRDNGKGFEVEKVFKREHSFGGNGLKNMKRRTEELGGTLEIISKVNQGTSVILDFQTKPTVKIFEFKGFSLTTKKTNTPRLSAVYQ